MVGWMDMDGCTCVERVDIWWVDMEWLDMDGMSRDKMDGHKWDGCVDMDGWTWMDGHGLPQPPRTPPCPVLQGSARGCPPATRFRRWPGWGRVRPGGPGGLRRRVEPGGPEGVRGRVRAGAEAAPEAAAAPGAGMFVQLEPIMGREREGGGGEQGGERVV